MQVLRRGSSPPSFFVAWIAWTFMSEQALAQSPAEPPPESSNDATPDAAPPPQLVPRPSAEPRPETSPQAPPDPAPTAPTPQPPGDKQGAPTPLETPQQPTAPPRSPDDSAPEPEHGASEEKKSKLVARLKGESTKQTQPADPPQQTPGGPRSSLLPRPIAQARPTLLPEVTRRDLMPGDYVARPLTLPRGTFHMEFGVGTVLANAPPQAALAPAFGLGITEHFEIGVDAPLRHDSGLHEWTALDPRPHLAATWIDEEQVEFGTRLRAIIPTSNPIRPSLCVALPLLWHSGPTSRIDVAPELNFDLEEATPTLFSLPVGATVQVTPGVFLGAGATANVALLSHQQSGVDGRLTLGLTFQAQGRAYVDFITSVFAKHLGGGADGGFSDGAGAGFSVVFFPELY